MAAGGAVCRFSPADSSQENAEADPGEAGSLHERLVAYVHSLEHGSRRGVWGEHSYARTRLSGSAGREVGGTWRARALLAPKPPQSPTTLIDVEGLPSPPRSPPFLHSPNSPHSSHSPPQVEEDDDPADAEDWEARVMALAPSPSHLRLATAAMDALRRMRLERLAEGGGRRARGQARAASRRLRLALASTWLPTSGPRAAPSWLQSALTSCMPRGPRRLYEETLSALRRSRPRLAERLSGPRALSPTRPYLSHMRGHVPPQSEPWLVWVSSGCEKLDERWERRLSGLVHTRVLRVRGEMGAPEGWCAGVAGAVRSQLTDALAEAGDRSVILGGVGAGAALCLLLARGAGGAEKAAGGVRGAVLVAPPLRTAEGGRGNRDDALRAVRLPLLLLVGTHAADAPRAIAHEVCERSGAGGAGPRRVLEVHGADGSLRLPRRLRRRLRLPQHALDAALVEECVRWAIETAEGEELPSSPPRPPPSPSPTPTPTPSHSHSHSHYQTPTPTPSQVSLQLSRRHLLPTIVHQIDLDDPEEDYSHLTTASAPPSLSTPPPIITAQSARSIEIIEGRVVSRAAGGTPMPLLPPCPPCPPCPSPADIMQMPIVFADDNATDSSSAGSPVTVTSGKARGSSVTPPVKMTRVILAKRGGGGGPPQVALSGPPMGALAGRAGGGVLTIRPRTGAGPTPPTRGVRVRVRGAGAGNAPRRLLVGQGMRVISRPDKS